MTGPALSLTDDDLEAWGESFDDDTPTTRRPEPAPTLRCVYQLAEDDDDGGP